MLDNSCSLPEVIKGIKLRTSWAGHVECMWKMRNVYKIVVGKPEGKIILEKFRHRLENTCNIQIDLVKIGCGVSN
jgi:hypothetical protein